MDNYKLSVVYINTHDATGGAAKVALMLKNGLKVRQCQTKMLVGQKHSTDPDVKVIKNAVKETGSFYSQQGLLYYDIDSTFDITSLDDFIGADIVHLHNLHGDYFNPFALPYITQAKPTVWTLHDMQAITGQCAHSFDCEKWKTGCGDCPYPQVYPGVVKDNTAKLWADKKNIYRQSNITVVVPSLWLKDKIEQSILGDKKNELIYNGIDTDIFQPAPKQLARNRLNLPRDAVILAFASHGGMNSIWRDGPCLAQTVQLLTQRFKSIYFLNIGSSSNQYGLKNIINIPHVVNEADLAFLYSAADLFLFPSLADNCPLVVMEAMACGLPVIAYRTGGVPEIVENQKTGLIVDYKNIDQFIRAAAELITSPDTIKQFSRSSVERARRYFSSKTMLDEYLRLYCRIIEERNLLHTRHQTKILFQENPLAAQSSVGQYLVSAVVSTYDAEENIGLCLEDLESQTIADRLEIIVVNSGSGENEESIVKSFQQKYNNIKYIKTEQRETIYSAWNRAIKIASGKYITNANTDDRHTKNALEKMALVLEQNPDKALVYANQEHLVQKQGRQTSLGPDIKGEFARCRLFAGHCPPGSQPMWRKSVHDIFGYFDPSFAVSGDFEFWFRISQKFDFQYLNETLGQRFIGHQTVSQSNRDLLEWENMVILKCYRYALEQAITINAKGISDNPLFAQWPEVNIWKERVRGKLTGREPRYLSEDVKQSWDYRANQSPALSIIVVTCNRPDLLFENLSALNNQTDKNFEVIVVNNGQPVTQLLQPANQYSYPLCYIEMNNNFGPSPSRNTAIRYAKAPYIAFLDDDAVAESNFVKNVVHNFSTSDTAGLRGRVLPRDEWHVNFSPPEYDLGKDFMPTICEVSSNMAFRRDVLINAGLFDPLLFGGEGVELSFRIFKLRSEKLDSILYCPNLMVFHKARKENLSLEKKIRLEEMMRLVIRRHGDCRAYLKYMQSLYPQNQGKVETDFLWMLDKCTFLQKNPAEALICAQKAVALNPDGIGGRLTLGLLYATVGKYDVAEPILVEVLSIISASLTDPGMENRLRAVMADGFIDASVKLALCYMKQHQYDKVKQIYTDLLNNPYVTVPQQQRSDIERVLAKLVNTEPARAFPTTKPSIPETYEPKRNYLVTAIVSTYNAEKDIGGCLDDLENQTIADQLEIIVVNSGSEQNEELIAREFQKKYSNIVYIKTDKREGLYSAWNRAVKAASGLFLTSANTDDRHRKDALKIMADALLASPDVALVYGDQIITDTPNDTFENHHGSKTAERPEYSRERLLFGCCVGSQPVWRKSLHGEFGYFDETLTCAGDWDFWLRISQRYGFKHIPEFLGLYYFNQDGIEHGKKIHSLYERYLVGKRYGTPYISVIPLYQNKDNPLVSVIMPAYNADEYIAEAIESVLIQNYRNFELIVVDDGSTDRTADIVHGFKSEPIKYFFKENGGVASARNFGLKKSSGSFIIMLDSDDMMTPDYIARHLQGFEQHPEADMVYCDDCLIDEDDKPIRVIERPEYLDRKLFIRDLFRAGFPVVHFKTCIRKSVFDKIGLFDEKLLVAEDYDMMRRFVKNGLKMHHLKGALYLRRMLSDSLSANSTVQKAKCHFDVVKRFTDTFAYDELFPDVAWDKIPAGQRQLHAKCLAAVTFLAIGQTYVEASSPVCAETAFDQACSELKECLKVDPDNRLFQQLLHKFELVRAGCARTMQESVCSPT